MKFIISTREREGDTYSNESWEVSWGKGTSSVHVEDGSAATAGRPGLDTSTRLEIKVSTVGAGEFEVVVDHLWVSSEGEGVCALALGTLGDFSKSNHVSVEDGESEEWLVQRVCDRW